MSEGEAETEIQKIIGERRGTNRGLEYLVRWKGFSKNHDSWEPVKNLKHANEVISNFKSKLLAIKAVKSRNRSKSASRSRSRSRGRSKSKSPARSKKAASPSRTTRAIEAVSTSLDTATVLTKQETKTVTVTNLPDKKELITETITKSVDFPNESHQSTFFSKTTKVQTSSKVIGLSKATDTTDGSCKTWCDSLCAQVQRVRHCGVKGLIQCDYPVMVVFVTVVVIILTFVLERYVNFSLVGEYLSLLAKKE